MASPIATAMATAAASMTDAASASITSFASESYFDSDYGTQTWVSGTFTDDAAYRASTPEAWAPPDGVEPNYDGSNPNGTAYIVVTVIGLTVATMTTLTRIYTKAFIKRCLGWDDYTCGLALIGLFIWSGTTIQMALMSLGDHVWNVILPVYKIEQYFHLQFISGTVYQIVMALVKASIVLLYLRTFSVCGRKFRITLYCVIGLLITSHLVVIPVYWLSIHPLKCQWKYLDLTDGDYYSLCHERYNDFAYLIYVTSLSVLLDVVIIALPCREVWRLQMVRRQKIALLLVFLAGIVVTIASILRLVFMIHRYYLDKYWDDNYTEWQMDMASTVELCLALICASVPPLQAFVQRFFPSLLNLDAPKSSPNLEDVTFQIHGWPKRHVVVSSTSQSDSTVTADVERQAHSPNAQSDDGSYVEIHEHPKKNPKYGITNHLIEPRSGFYSEKHR